MTYILEILIKKDKRIRIGSLGEMNFKRGLYFYIGSDKRNNYRINRHLRKKKRLFWHIDYLLSSNFLKIKKILIKNEIGECSMARFLYREGYNFIHRFGSSDCNCYSHLFFIGEGINRIQGLLKEKGFRCLEISLKN